MSLRGVKMAEEVWLTCLAHALTTETEEIMGLLLGDIQVINGGSVALVWGASPQMRSDRRKDRVETNPELLAAASAQAERMTLNTGRITRVIGWYHSHPHITVLPSHVDVHTQAMYQLLDPGFVGLIFSCFSEDAQKIGRIQVIAFQSLDGKEKCLSNMNDSPVIDVESSWNISDNSSASSSVFTGNFDQDTGDSKLAKSNKVGGRSSHLEDSSSHANINYLGKQRSRGNPSSSEGLTGTDANVDSSEMSDTMQEALHRSNMDISGAEYVRKEVFLEVLPSCSLLNLDAPLSSFMDMQQVLFEEERSAYGQALSQNVCNGRIHPLTFIHHASTYQASLCKLMEQCLCPAINVLQYRLLENKIRLATLVEEAKLLECEFLGRGSEEYLSRGASNRSRSNLLYSGEKSHPNSGSSMVSRRKGH